MLYRHFTCELIKIREQCNLQTVCTLVFAANAELARAAGEMLALLIYSEECGVESVHYVGSYVPYVRPLIPLRPKPKRSSNESRTSEAHDVDAPNDSADDSSGVDPANRSLNVSALSEQLEESTTSRNLLLRLIKFVVRNEVHVRLVEHLLICVRTMQCIPTKYTHTSTSSVLTSHAV